jgi:hypothetical protein
MAWVLVSMMAVAISVLLNFFIIMIISLCE